MMSTMMRLRVRTYSHYILDLAAFAALFVALSLPNRLIWVAPPAFVFFPLELLGVCALLLLPGRAGRVSLVVLSGLLGLSLILRFADLATHEIFNRPFNLIFDSHLLADASRLLSGVLGEAAVFVVGLLLVLLTAVLGWLAFALLGRIRRVLHNAPRVSGGALLVLLAVWSGLKIGGWSRADTFAWDQLVMHGRDTVRSYRDIQEFAVIVNDDAWARRSGAALFDRLQGKDVLLIFAESYGRVLLEQPPFAASVRAKLELAERRLSQDGYLMRSAFLTAPTVGGLSWLAHASVLSGAWIDSETRYKSLMLSERATLNRLFRDAGWRTVAAMPAISMAWPEGQYYGYDYIYDAHNFGYQGLPFNWVTMPDQYVLSALQARERSTTERAPLMAEIALISSHAPWTPIATLVPWSQVGDGRIFNEQAQAGPTPEQVWRNVDTIREHYRLSIEYMLETVVSYIETYGDDELVVILMGDHQAAPMISGDSEGKDVPVHIITRDPVVLQAITHWDWQPGLLPDERAPVWRMDEVRDRFIEAFSSDHGISAHTVCQGEGLCK